MPTIKKLHSIFVNNLLKECNLTNYSDLCD